jgi:predicted nucleic acid-binding protein
VDAFDSDVLIYAAAGGHLLGESVRALFSDEVAETVGIGSVLLLPEVLAKPLREADSVELTELGSLLGRLELHAVDRAIARAAVTLSASYRLKAADAIHLATAVLGGADRFVTNNRGDFSKSIVEIEVVYPDELPG